MQLNIHIKKLFKKSLCEIVQLPNEQLRLYANQADEVKKKFSTDVWKEYMIKVEYNAL